MLLLSPFMLFYGLTDAQDKKEKLLRLPDGRETHKGGKHAREGNIQGRETCKGDIRKMEIYKEEKSGANEMQTWADIPSWVSAGKAAAPPHP